MLRRINRPHQTKPFTQKLEWIETLDGKILVVGEKTKIPGNYSYEYTIEGITETENPNEDGYLIVLAREGRAGTKRQKIRIHQHAVVKVAYESTMNDAGAWK